MCVCVLMRVFVFEFVCVYVFVFANVDYNIEFVCASVNYVIIICLGWNFKSHLRLLLIA